MKVPVVLTIGLLLLLITIASADQIAITEDGKKVLLKDDGTWKYLEKSEAPKKQSPLEFRAIKTEQVGDMVIVQVKVTNTSGRHIKSCEVTCVILDEKERELGFDKHYAVKVTEGGLPPEASNYQQFFFNAVKASDIRYFQYSYRGLEYK